MIELIYNVGPGRVCVKGIAVWENHVFKSRSFGTFCFRVYSVQFIADQWFPYFLYHFLHSKNWAERWADDCDPVGMENDRCKLSQSSVAFHISQFRW